MKYNACNDIQLHWNQMNPYQNFASSFVQLGIEGKSLPLGGILLRERPKPATNAPVALIFSPHPDDECLVAGFALRLMHEAGTRIINIAVTQGSRKDRQEPRLKELENACSWLGFDLEQTAPGGLEKINLQTRDADPAHWHNAVDIITATLLKHQPQAIFFPHEADWNATHIGTHFLVMDALKRMPADFQCLMIETEYWAPMMAPNLMVESSADDVADLLTALSFHVGEVQRNPYHLRMPAWLQDNVRRGAELVGGQGGAAPDFAFATLYRLRQWKNGGVIDIYSGGKQISVAENAACCLNSPGLT
ncbi:MAG TPA: PIG-L family deacetylase [Pseudomonadales bacterium]|nr:PIG-L family deacetylase [Pseudomonadales bacterium]